MGLTAVRKILLSDISLHILFHARFDTTDKINLFSGFCNFWKAIFQTSPIPSSSILRHEMALIFCTQERWKLEVRIFYNADYGVYERAKSYFRNYNFSSIKLQLEINEEKLNL